MLRALFLVSVLAALVGCGSTERARTAPGAATYLPETPQCVSDSAPPWQGEWLTGWEITSTDVLALPDAPAPDIVFFDSTCVYTTSPVSAPSADAVPGPGLRGVPLAWRSAPHGGTLTLPDSSEMPVTLATFTSVFGDQPYFVMAAPSFWEQAGVDSEELGRERLVAAVFVHEFSHTRHAGAYGRAITSAMDSLDALGLVPDTAQVGDEFVQRRFRDDSVYVAAYEAERDLLRRAADAATDAEARRLGADALAMMRQRRADLLSVEPVLLATDDLFLSMEGAGQMAGLGWLTHPGGGGLDRATAIEGWDRGGWPERHGLALFLLLDRLTPDWPLLVYGDGAPGAESLLVRAVE